MTVENKNHNTGGVFNVYMYNTYDNYNIKGGKRCGDKICTFILKW